MLSFRAYPGGSMVQNRREERIPKPGAHYAPGNQCTFCVWAPLPNGIRLQFPEQKRTVALEEHPFGYWAVTVDDVAPGQPYWFELEKDRTRPDPVSYSQPTGVHGPSAVVDHTAFSWTDQKWRGIDRSDLVIYELHVGTFTPEGTFDAVIPRLEQLADLGITAIELMPVAAFPGARNWGYDGVYPYAVAQAYGGPERLKRLVDASHARGIAVILDVVYNHLGPEGNYLWEFGPYFTEKYKTPWGWAINFDGPQSDPVRRYFIDNAIYWIEQYHLDGLRFDAIHGIYDFGAKHVLTQLTQEVEFQFEGGHRRIHLIAESDLNDRRVVLPRHEGGFGMHAQWMDDFHHAVHTLVTKETIGYYEDFGSISDLAKASTKGFVYSWDYSRHRQRHFGSPSDDIPGDRFVVCIQNHDQVGNRMLGERLHHITSFEAAKLAAVATAWAPCIPLFFMGEEYAERAPFYYFVSHGDPGLVEAVRAGRKNEFASFHWDREPPDPQSEETFFASKLHWEQRTDDRHGAMLAFYKELLRIRSATPALASLDKQACSVECLTETDTLVIIRHHPRGTVVTAFHFSDFPVQITNAWTDDDAHFLLCSSDETWHGPGVEHNETTSKHDIWHLAPWSCLSYLSRNDTL